MIELLAAPEHVVAFKAIGHVEANDYEEVLKPALERSIAEGGKARVVFVLGPEFEGYSAGAVWQDLTLWAPHLTRWERCAIVTDHSTLAGALRFFGAVMPGTMKVFPTSDTTDALAWAAAQ